MHCSARRRDAEDDWSIRVSIVKIKVCQGNLLLTWIIHIKN
jgi:hypothetical protein